MGPQFGFRRESDCTCESDWIIDDDGHKPVHHHPPHTRVSMPCSTFETGELTRCKLALARI